MNDKLFVNEVRGFLFYSKLIWPIHRKIAKSLITPRCKKCIISANCLPLNSDGLCSICAETKSPSTNFNTPSNSQESKDLAEQMNHIVTETLSVNKSQYDALVLFSGGKDSTYLVKTLMDTYPQMKILLCSVDNTFMSPIALQNLNTLVKKFNLPYISIRPPASLYDKMFRYAFTHLNAKGCSGTVDQFDGDLIHDVARNWAAQNKIPLIFSGCSRTQVERILGLKHFEFSREFETSRRKKIADISLNEIFNSEEMRYWMNENGQEDTVRPRLLFPFYIWNLDEEEILAQVTKWNLLIPSVKNPLLTNNQLIPTMAIVDMVKFGYSSFEPEFCQMVRQGKADPVFWKNVFELSEYAAKTGRFVSKSVDLALKRLNLTRKELGIPE